jgi:hypothetical protein
MTNEHIERLTGSLWMVTKPGGYAHLNQLGRVYREKEVALRHRDFDEVVVELRLADEPEGPASLVGALQDVVHTDPGGVRAGRSVRQVEPPKIDWDALEQAKKDDAAAFANTWGEIKSGLSVEPSAVNSIVRMREALRWIADEGLSCGDYAACVHEAKAALSQPKRPEGET